MPETSPVARARASARPALARLFGRGVVLRDRSDLLGRVYLVAVVARSLLAAHTVFVNIYFVIPYSYGSFGVILASVVLVLWHAFISTWMLDPDRRTGLAHLADLAVTVGLILSTLVLVPPGGAPLSMAGYWAAGCAAYAAILRGTSWGVWFALVTSIALLGEPSHFELERLGAAFVTIVLIASLGVLIQQFRVTIIEQERERAKSAAVAERARLSRIVHDGALQVLALVEREGPLCGERGLRLAALARESEAQLRALLQDREHVADETGDVVDMAAVLDRYQSASVTVSTMASLALAPRSVVDEVEAAVTEILKNVELHAGPDAQAWILLDQENEGEVILWVRDNGRGVSQEQVAQAAESGRMGIKDSIVGRIAALGGSAVLKSTPGVGAEWELRIPIQIKQGSAGR